MGSFSRVILQTFVVPREQVQYLLGHSDARTTDLYNRTDKEVSSNIVERIFI